MQDVMQVNQLLVQYFLENEYSKKSPKKEEIVDDVGRPEEDLKEIVALKSSKSTPPKEEGMQEDLQNTVDDNFDSIFKTQGQQVKEVTACPHKDRRHYAKVSFLLIC